MFSLVPSRYVAVRLSSVPGGGLERTFYSAPMGDNNCIAQRLGHLLCAFHKPRATIISSSQSGLCDGRCWSPLVVSAHHPRPESFRTETAVQGMVWRGNLKYWVAAIAHKLQRETRFSGCSYGIPRRLMRNICHHSFWLWSSTNMGTKLKICGFFSISAHVIAVMRGNGARGLFRALVHDHYHPRFLWPTKTDCTTVVMKATSTLKLVSVLNLCHGHLCDV